MLLVCLSALSLRYMDFSTLHGIPNVVMSPDYVRIKLYYTNMKNLYFKIA